MPALEKILCSMKLETLKAKPKPLMLRFLHHQMGTFLIFQHLVSFSMQEQIKFEREICKPTPRATIKNNLMFYYMVKDRDIKIPFHSKVQCEVVANKNSQSQF